MNLKNLSKRNILGISSYFQSMVLGVIVVVAVVFGNISKIRRV